MASKKIEAERERRIAEAVAWLDARGVTEETPESAFTFADSDEAYEVSFLLSRGLGALTARSEEVTATWKYRRDRSDANIRTSGGHTRASSVHFTAAQVDEARQVMTAADQAYAALFRRSKAARKAAADAANT